MAKHFDTCNANYPEKIKGEAPQQAQRIDLPDGEWVDVCVDCGATLASNLGSEGEEEKG